MFHAASCTAKRSLLSSSFLQLSLFALLVHSGTAATYVAGSLTDSNATSGNGVSSPAGPSNIQYSDGSGTFGNYGQIDIANDPADPDWRYDLGSTTAITSLTFWSEGTYLSYSQMPSGTITIYGSASVSGPWSQIGQVTRTMVRDIVLPNSQATAGEGFRVRCDGSSYRYVRINVVTPGSIGGLDNRWKIRRVEVNKDLVIHDFYRASDGSSAINDLPRIPYNIVDGNNSTMWNPQSTNMYLTLDLGPDPRRFQQIILTPNAGDGSFLPQKGEVRVSSTDDPDNMDTVVGLFNVSWNNENTDGVTIILPQPFKKRFVQVHWDSVRNPARTQTRIAEIAVDTVPDKPDGQDLTSTGIPAGYRVTTTASATTNTTNLNAALNQYGYVYLPPGTYNFNGNITMPTDARLYGYSDDTTILRFTTTNSSIRVKGTDFVSLDHFRFERTVDNATAAAILIEQNNGDIPCYTEIDNVKIINNRSREASISIEDAAMAGVTNCRVLNPQRVISQPDALDPNGPNYWYIYGSGISVGRSENLYIANNHVEEERNMMSLLPASPRKKNFYQAGGIEPASCSHAVVSNNTVRKFGNGIDINGSSDAWVISNFIKEIAETGVKLANGTNDCYVLSNTLDKCALAAIWLNPGSAQLSVHHNRIGYNDIYETGQGFNSVGWNSNSYWLNHFTWSPSSICVDSAPTDASRARYNIITNNESTFNGGVKSPASTYTFYINPLSFAPVWTASAGNVIH